MNHTSLPIRSDQLCDACEYQRHAGSALQALLQSSIFWTGTALILIWMSLCRRQSTEGTLFCISSTKPCCDLQEISMYIYLICLYMVMMVYPCIYMCIPVHLCIYHVHTYIHKGIICTYQQYTMYMSIYTVSLNFWESQCQPFPIDQQYKAISEHINRFQANNRANKLLKYNSG